MARRKNPSVMTANQLATLLGHMAKKIADLHDTVKGHEQGLRWLVKNKADK